MRVARILYVQAVLTALALCVLWQGVLVRQAGYRLERLRRDAEERQAEVEKYRAQVSKLKSPQRVVQLVEKLGLNLALPPVENGAATTQRREEDTDAEAPPEMAAD